MTSREGKTASSLFRGGKDEGSMGCVLPGTLPGRINHRSRKETLERIPTQALIQVQNLGGCSWLGGGSGNGGGGGGQTQLMGFSGAAALGV